MPIEQSLIREIGQGEAEATACIHLENEYNLNLPEKTFNADSWSRLTWTQAVQDMMEVVKANTKDIVELFNNTLGTTC